MIKSSGFGSGNEVEEVAFAKVNLYLEVVGRRQDGYHLVETVLHTIDLADRIRLCARPEGIRLETAGLRVPAGSANLAIRAARALQEATGGGWGVKIVLRKRIPVAAGLGGGSSDAAAVLRGCRALLDLPVTEERLSRIAAGLGADVPFFLKGGAAIGRGVGDKIQPLPSLAGGRFVVVVPKRAVKTAQVYRRLAAVYPRRAGEVRTMAEAITRSDWTAAASAVFNRLEEVTRPMVPAVGIVMRRLNEWGADGVVMSGSGAAVVGLAGDANRAAALEARARQYYRQVFLCRPAAVG